MNLNKEPQNKPDICKEIKSLIQKVETAEKYIEQGNSSLSSELKGVQKRLRNLLVVQKQYEDVLNTSVKLLSESIYDRIDSMIAAIFKKENDIWLFDPFLPSNQIPRFVPISKRSNKNHSKSTRFVSFINFKGGVGKTTLTANLAAAFATGNYRIGSTNEKVPKLRVLVVDLDFQGTLSDRCMAARPLINAWNTGKTSAELLKSPVYSQFKIEDLALDFDKLDAASIIPAEDKLDLTDNKHFIKLAFRRRDIRYCYRLWFHKQQVFDAYDLVLFDCPPRKTASSICALTASDFVFVPTALESFDINSVSRTINWLISFRHKMGIPLKIGGVIFNRTQFQDKFSPAEKDQATLLRNSLQNDYSELESDVKKSYVTENGLPSIFQSHIPKRQGTKSINGERGETLPGSLEKRSEFSFFTDVASEMYERIYQ